MTKSEIFYHDAPAPASSVVREDTREGQRPGLFPSPEEVAG